MPWYRCQAKLNLNQQPGFPEDFYSRGYNLIDGHHRLAKAEKCELASLSAYIIRMEQHISFMTEGFETYVGYWNNKLKQT